MGLNLDKMTNLTTKCTINVRYGETDQMGVVYHGNYAQYFEVARIDWLSKIGISYKEMEQNGVMLPVVSLANKFIKSAFFADDLTIITSLKKMPTAKIEFGYKVFNQEGELLTTAETILVFVSMETKRPIKCPDYVMNKINDYFNLL